MAEREHDIVLFGATGFTGGLTAEYLAEHAAGDDADRARRAQPGQARGRARADGSAEPGSRRHCRCSSADVTDEASVRAVAEATKVVITTVGPYIRYGEPLVAACAATGTDYVDLTGEPEFVDLMYLRHHEQAAATGARIVHSCGFDSIPYDLGVLFTVLRLPEDVPLKLEGFVRAGGTFSGRHLPVGGRGDGAAALERSHRPPAPPAGGQARRPAESTASPGFPTAIPRPAAGWCRSRRSIPRRCSARRAALDRYGPDFTYSHYLVLKRLPMVAGLGVGAGDADRARTAAADPAGCCSSSRPRARAPRPSSGPRVGSRCASSARRRGAGSWPRSPAATPATATPPRCSPSPGCAWPTTSCRRRAGQLTPATAMGEALIERLQRAGIAFEVLEETGAPRPGAGRGDRVSPTGEDAVAAAQDAFGRHPGHRALHARGTLLRGTFTATPEAAALTSAAHMQGEAGPGHGALLQWRRESEDPRLRPRRPRDGDQVLPS